MEARTSPQRPSATNATRAVVGAAMLVLWLARCTGEDPPTAPRMRALRGAALASEEAPPCHIAADMVSAGATRGQCLRSWTDYPPIWDPTAYTVIASPNTLRHTTWVEYWGPPANVDPITVTFGEPVYGIHVEINGYLNCNDLGSVAFSGPGGSTTLPFRDADTWGGCLGADHATGVAKTDVVPGGVTQLVIQPMNPIDWQYFNAYYQQLVWARGFAPYNILWQKSAPEPPPKLTVACAFPVGQTRGSTVDCTAKVTPDSFAFQITRRLAIRQNPIEIDLVTAAMNYVPNPIESTTRIDVAARQTYHWSGPAVTPTAVAIEATVGTSSGAVQLADSSRFTPANRGWARMAWDEGRSVRHDDSLAKGADRMGRAAASRFSTLPVNTGGLGTQLGTFLPDAPDSTKLPLKAVLAGPDSGLFYLSGAPSSGPWYRIFVIPAIVQPLSYKASKAVKDTISRWQKRQIGYDATGNPIDLNNGSRRWCNSALLDSTARFVKRHEGWGKARSSHWGIGDSVFANSQTRLQDYLDGWVWGVDPTTGKASARVTWRWYGVIFYGTGSPYAVPQAAFDSPTGPEYTAVNSICSFLP